MNATLFTSLAVCYDRLNRILSLGLDLSWRSRALRLLPAPPVNALDLATGTGDFAFALSRLAPEANILAVDLTPAMLARATVKGKGLSRITFVSGDAQDLTPLKIPNASCDLVLSAFGFRNFSDSNAVMDGITRIITSDGRLLVLELFRPACGPLATLTRLWTLLVATLFAPRHLAAYRHLNDSISTTSSAEAFIRLVEPHGFILTARETYFPNCTALLFSRHIRA